jgi:hypothetical protein
MKDRETPERNSYFREHEYEKKEKRRLSKMADRRKTVYGSMFRKKATSVVSRPMELKLNNTSIAEEPESPCVIKRNKKRVERQTESFKNQVADQKEIMDKFLKERALIGKKKKKKSKSRSPPKNNMDKTDNNFFITEGHSDSIFDNKGPARLTSTTPNSPK